MRILGRIVTFAMLAISLLISAMVNVGGGEYAAPISGACGCVCGLAVIFDRHLARKA